MRADIASVAVASLIAALVWVQPAPAQTRSVIVNGQRLNEAQIAFLEERACTRIPNGEYWLNPQTGVWGYVGRTRREGVIGDACGRQQQRRSLSERRELYRPGEILGR